MATIAEIREKYPQYTDLSDEQLAQGLHKKHYSDMPYEEFAKRVGLQAAPEQPPKQPATGGIGNVVKNAYGGYWEPLLQVGTGMAATPIAGLAGIAQGAKNLIPGMQGMEAGNRAGQVQSALTYQPRTAAGQMGSRVIAYPLEKLAQLADAAGNLVNETDKPGTTYLSGQAANAGLEPVRQVESGPNPLRAGAAATLNTAIQAAPALLLRGRSGGVAGNVAPRTGRTGSGVAAGETPATPAISAPAQRPAGLANVPSKDALKKASRAAYKRSEEIGAVVTEDSFGKAQASIAEMLQKEGIDPTLHPSTTAALKRIADAKGPITLEQLETLRKIAKDAESSLSPADKRLAAKTVDAIDEFAESLTAADLRSGTPEAAAALKEARNYWSRARKADVLDELMERAELSAPNFSASGMENAIRTEFRNLAKNQRRIRMFTAEEQAAIKKVAQGGPLENSLRMLGKLAPTGVVSGALSSGAGFVTGGPLGAVALPAAGAAARYAATRMTKRNAQLANALMRRGPLPPAVGNPRALSEALRKAEIKQ